MTSPGGSERIQSVRFDRVADRYDETRGGLERGAHLAAAIGPHLHPGHRVIEVGVGTGIVSSALHRAGWPVLGVDLSFPMLRRARERLGPRVALADAQLLPVRGLAVENVVMVWVLHLVADVLAVLQEVERVLRPRARVTIVPGRPTYRDDDINEVMAGLGSLSSSPSDTPDRLIDFGREAGMEPVHLGDCGLTEFDQSPAQVATGLERRDFSWVWDLDARTWHAVVQPVIDGLRALPHPERPRRRANRHALLVLERR